MSNYILYFRIGEYLHIIREMRYTGTVIWFCVKKNYGFIKWAGGEDMFAHWSDITMEGFKVLKKGQEVEFSVGENNHGKPKAIDIKIINEKA